MWSRTVHNQLKSASIGMSQDMLMYHDVSKYHVSWGIQHGIVKGTDWHHAREK